MSLLKFKKSLLRGKNVMISEYLSDRYLECVQGYYQLWHAGWTDATATISYMIDNVGAVNTAKMNTVVKRLFI